MTKITLVFLILKNIATVDLLLFFISPAIKSYTTPHLISLKTGKSTSARFQLRVSDWIIHQFSTIKKKRRGGKKKKVFRGFSIREASVKEGSHSRRQEMDAAAQPALKDALIAIPDINVESHTQHPQQPQGAAAAE